MALIVPRYLNSVVAIGRNDGNGGTAWMGTGFLFGYRYKDITYDEGVYNIFLVTNKHVVNGVDSIILKFNPQGNLPAKDYTLNLTNNSITLYKMHPNPNIDVAVMPLTQSFYDGLKNDGVNPNFFQYDTDSYYISDMKNNIGTTEGDEVYALGYPMGIVGNTRQYVILRSGVIARVRDMLDGYSTDFIIDAPVFPGNSGGPVVVRPEFTCINGTKNQTESRLIGLIKAYIPYQDVAISPQTGRPRVSFEENTGLSLVEPVDHIINAILQP